MSIYLAAVIPDKTDPFHTPYVSTALGPYHPDEIAAMERGKAWLRDTYATEDVRRCEPPRDGDADYARGLVLRVVQAEAEQKRLKAERERAEEALSHVQPERWPSDVDPEQLDDVLVALGVNPEDV
ncbi:hypothetical protein SEA_MARKY_72 [Streptomyces phage Marky]|nr:hypothetical protein SEA_MARKY_72 [Streptomyces phage Marky]